MKPGIPQRLIELASLASTDWTLPTRDPRLGAGVVLGDEVQEFARGSAQPQIACFTIPYIGFGDERDPAMIRDANAELAVASVQFVRALIAEQSAGKATDDAAPAEPKLPTEVAAAFDEIDDCMRMSIKVVPTGPLSVLRDHCARMSGEIERLSALLNGRKEEQLRQQRRAEEAQAALDDALERLKQMKSEKDVIEAELADRRAVMGSL